MALRYPMRDVFSDNLKRLPKAEHFHRAALELILFYHRRSGVHFPPLNAPLLLFRFIKRLTLPSTSHYFQHLFCC